MTQDSIDRALPLAASHYYLCLLKPPKPFAASPEPPKTLAWAAHKQCKSQWIDPLSRRLQAEGMAGATFTPVVADRDTVLLAHDSPYVDSFLDGTISEAVMREIGLPWSPALVQRTLVRPSSWISCV